MDVPAELRALLGDRAVISGEREMEPYLADWRGLFHGRASAVVSPASVADVCSVVRYCAQRAFPIVPQGGNTGLAAGATPIGLADAVIVSLSRLRAVRELDAVANTISVDAGCVLTDVRAAAERAGRMFPLSIASEGTAQVGGLIATNAGGSAVLRYGTMRGLVLGLEVVTADGTLVDGMRALRKDNAGYDWKQLFIGSEGTLGIITGAVLALVPRPSHRVTALLSANSLDDVLSAFASAQTALGDVLTAYELFSEFSIALRLETDASLRRPLHPQPWYVLLEAASSLTGLSDAVESALEKIMDAGYARECIVAASSSHADALWEWRETISETERRAGASAKHDVSVPTSSIPAFVGEATAEVETVYPGARVLAFGHIGDGNVHFNALLPSQEFRAHDVTTTVHAIVARYGGSVTAEHGIGRYRRADLARTRSAPEIALMRAVKHALDPSGIMNPGAVLESEG